MGLLCLLGFFVIPSMAAWLLSAKDDEDVG